MKPPPFEYHAPGTVGEAVALLSELGDDAKVIAGGQSLVPMLNLRLTQPGHLIDLGGVDGLRGVAVEPDRVRIGALVRHRDLERSTAVADALPVLAEAVRLIAHPPIRARGTVGGSIAHADPAAELPAVAVLLDATVVAVGPDGRREIPASQFFLGFLTTALRPGEVVTEVVFPRLPEGTGWAFTEVTRRHGDFALVGAAAAVDRRGDQVGHARTVVFGAASTPVRLPEGEVAVAGQAGGAATWQAASAAAAALDPPDDVHGTAAYRRHVAGALVEDSLAAAFDRAAR